MIEFKLPTMTCGHCERAVTQAVHEVDPAATVSVDLPSHTVRIESTRPAEAFVGPLTEEGYAPA